MSDPIESNAYLSTSFDPLTLRIAELRRIFLEHNIDFKSTAKKAELVQIFNDEVRPQAAALLRAKLSPLPSANVIETVGGASPASVTMASPAKTPGGRRGPGRPRKHALPDEDEIMEAKVAPPSTVKRGYSRPRKVPKVEEEEDVPIPPTITKSTARRRTVNAPPVADTEDEEMVDIVSTPAPNTAAKIRKSTVKAESKGPRFSDENPFQSGSPPALTVSPSKRRQTAIPNSSQKLAPPIPRESRRQTEGVLTPQSLSSPAGSSEIEFTFAKTANKTPKTLSPIRKSGRFMPPISQLKASPAFQSAAQRIKENSLATNQLLSTDTKTTKEVDTGEEFTAEEAATLPPSRRRLVRKHKGPSTLNQVLKWTSLVGLSVGSAYGANWYRQEKINVGFCGIDSDPIVSTPGASNFEELLQQVRPHCVPCPAHANCYPGFRMTCDDEFQKVNHPLSFGGLLPLAAECAPDTEKLQRIQVVVEEIVETLRDRTASVECGYTDAPTDGNVGISASDLKAQLLAKKSSAITAEQFETLFDHAIEEVKTREEIEVSSSKPSTKLPTNSQTNRLYDHTTGGDRGGRAGEAQDLYIENYYHSTSLANISVACSIRHTAYTVLARYRVEFVGLLTMLLLGLYLKNFFESRSLQRIRVQSLVSRVFDELSRMKARAVEEPNRFEPHLGVSQLRDSILADEFSYATREQLWQDVRAIVETNSNVRATQAEIQGEWLRAWEWVGAVRQITAAEKRRETGLEEGDEFVRPVV